MNHFICVLVYSIENYFNHFDILMALLKKLIIYSAERSETGQKKQSNYNCNHCRE